MKSVLQVQKEVGFNLCVWWQLGWKSLTLGLDWRNVGVTDQNYVFIQRTYLFIRSGGSRGRQLGGALTHHLYCVSMYLLGIEMTSLAETEFFVSVRLHVSTKLRSVTGLRREEGW